MALYRKFAKPCSIRQDLAYRLLQVKIQDIQNYKLFQSLDMVAKYENVNYYWLLQGPNIAISRLDLYLVKYKDSQTCFKCRQFSL